MNAPASLSESIHNDISIYLAPEEKILKALSPFAGNSSPSGQVWLILTTSSIVFHTREAGKEPLVALLPRNEIKEIEYFQRPTGVQLTFIPRSNTSKVSRLSFGVEKLDELEDFCEDLADFINFKKETNAGIKTYAPPLRQPEAGQPGSIAIKQPKIIDETNLKHAASAIRHADKPEPTAKAAVSTTTPPEKTPTTPFMGSSQTARSINETPEVKIIKPAPAAAANLEPSTTTQEAKGEGEFNPAYVLLATLISLLVAFIWYKFFMLLAGWKNTDKN